jgi:hypothetical protein
VRRAGGGTGGRRDKREKDARGRDEREKDARGRDEREEKEERRDEERRDERSEGGTPTAA